MTQNHSARTGARNSPLETPRQITEREFQLFQTLIYEKTGIFLPPVKISLVSGRLGKRLRELGLETYRQYYQRVVDDDTGGELTRMLDAITTNETQFFRESRHFDFLREQVYPRWRNEAENGVRQRKVRLWSAACSSGEEPYSIAMSLASELCRDDDWDIRILASDISSKVLDGTRRATWPIKRADEIPQSLLKRYMLKGTGSKEGTMRAGPELRKLVDTQYINLNDSRYPVAPGVDIIFCRNVLIYFDNESRTRVINRLLDLLAPDGYLFLGHAESLSGMNRRVKSVAPAIYTLA